MVLFAYNFQITKEISHDTRLLVIKVGSKSISVKRSAKNIFGHAGFLIKDYRVFNYINEFKNHLNLKKEMLVDHYFKYLFDTKN